jgi:hypothetical protein
MEISRGRICGTTTTTQPSKLLRSGYYVYPSPQNADAYNTLLGYPMRVTLSGGIVPKGFIDTLIDAATTMASCTTKVCLEVLYSIFETQLARRQMRFQTVTPTSCGKSRNNIIEHANRTRKKFSRVTIAHSSPGSNPAYLVS